jgi:hypothetical protein
MVNLTMPLSTWLGLLEVPSEVTGFGPLTADDSRHLATAMAEHSQTRWCVTLTGGDGRPVAHGCARPVRGLPGPPPSPGRQRRKAQRRPSPVIQRRPLPIIRRRRRKERHASPHGWRASPHEMVRVRRVRPRAAIHGLPATVGAAALDQGQAQTCAFPGCRRPASQCDLDHTAPFQRGGLTCECNLAPPSKS